ncbi:hypothetical protein [Gynurincola endophyticus]|jgi:hypothetical protein|uniref:hypothetical protein n=1 Tax=Gynurincola endophyticus TaxID=2479004 RepID=UPI000F8CDD08|nr:hypothetical protein [Gynurincola endophyticus]
MNRKQKVSLVILFTGVALYACSKKVQDIVTLQVDEPEESVMSSAYTDSYTPGTTLYGDKNFVQFTVGDSNTAMIVTAGHGGTLRPAFIPDRTQGETAADLNTADLARRIADSIKNRIGVRPHVIINNLHRIKLDPNRPEDELYLTHDSAKVAYDQYHEFIFIARRMVTERIGKGLLLDVHGHAHAIDRTELGYLTTRTQINATDVSLNTRGAQSSIKNIWNGSTFTYSELLRGSKAFGTLMENEGMAAVPSQQDPSPGTAAYFNGGYTTLVHGSKDSGTISAIQLEFPRPSVRESTTTRAAAASKLANVVRDFLAEHYNFTY